VPEAAILEVFATLLGFDYFQDSVRFTIGNAGNEPLDWSSSSAAAYLTLTPGSGTMPNGGGWSEIRCIELATGTESPSTGLSVNPGTVMRLHPSGDYIYGANNGVSPSDAEKYDIRPGVAAYLYDSPYHGDFAFSGNLWLNEAGTKMFTRSSNVFRLSDVPANDMIYDGQLPNAGPIQALAHSGNAGRQEPRRRRQHDLGRVRGRRLRDPIAAREPNSNEGPPTAGWKGPLLANGSVSAGISRPFRS